MADALIIDAVRTPRGVGKPDKGAFARLHPQHLSSTVLRAIAERNEINTDEVDDVIWSTCAQIDKQSGNIGRMSALDAGYDVKSSGVTLDRFCGGGITAVNLAAASIMSNMEDLIIAGGTEMLSLVNALPASEVSAWGDRGNMRLRALHPQANQGVCADAIAAMEGITRADVDAIGLESQRRAAKALAEGAFVRSLVPVYDVDRSLLLDHEEFPRPQTTKEILEQLKPSFAALADLELDDRGTTYRKLIQRIYPQLHWDAIHHAGNSSGIVDGSAAVLLASARYASKRGLRARAKVVAFANAGDSPTLMLNAPVPAARKVLRKAGLTKDDIDLWEVNEAFAVVVEKFVRDLGLDRDRVNVNGGAIALGHPIGATGAILIGTMVDELERRGLKRGLVTMCAAGGMAPAIVIERI
jgi:acetyl-CoA C-acetyltransferase